MERSRQRTDRLPLALLALAMGASAIWLMVACRGLTFSGDEVFYYSRFVFDDQSVSVVGGLEYFLAPHNGHLVLLGKLIYRGLFLTVGTDYAVFRAIEVASLLVTVGLFFVLVRRRLGAWAALIPSVLLLFLGYGGETLMWPFDMHTLLALALGLGTLLALERGDRRGDLTACLLLLLAVSMVEVGIAFTVGAAVSILLRPERRRRAWVFAIPLALFAVWWPWALHFGPRTLALTNVHLIPIDFANALAAVVGSIFGLNPTGNGVSPFVTTVTPWGTALAALAALGLAFRIGRGKVPDGLWVSLAVLLTYWLMIALTARLPDASRYIFVGTTLVLLTAAYALPATRPRAPALIAAACLVAVAIPANIAKFYDERRPSITDSENTRTEYAMIELTRNRVAPDYMAASDPNVVAAGGIVFVPLSAGEYLRSAGEFGSLAYSLDQVREQRLVERTVADATLVGALRIDLREAAPAAEPEACPSSLDGRPGHSVFFPLQRGGALLGSRSKRPVEVAIGRFGKGGQGVRLGRLEPGRWGRLSVPRDGAPDPWWAVVDGPVYVCPVTASSH